MVKSPSPPFGALTNKGFDLQFVSHAAGILVPDFPQALKALAAANWPTLAAAAAQGLTLVVYMGVRQLGAIVAGLCTTLPAHTPAALVQSASTPQEQRLVCTLATLQQCAARAGIASPAVLIVGDVLAAAASAPAASEPRVTAAHG